MDNYTIFTKTAKGLGEALGKTKNLSREQRKILKEIDGKASFEDLVEQIGMDEVKLGAVINKLLADDYIREFGSSAPPGARPSGETVFDLTSPGIIEVANSQLTIGDFFRAMETPPAQSGDAGVDFRNLGHPEAEIARKTLEQTAAQVDEIRRAIEEEAQRITARTQQQAAEAARREAETKAQQEAERARQQALAQEQARRAAQEQARKAAEEAERQAARIRAEQEARRQAEEAARREAEERARRQAEEQARRQAEEAARRLAQEQAQEQARIKAEQEARVAAEARAREEAAEQERARLQAMEEERRAAEARAREEAEARARREAEEQARRQLEEEARRVTEEEARKQAQEQARIKAWEAARRAAEELAQREAEEKARVEAERLAQIRAEEEARLAAEAEARRQAEEAARLAAEAAARREAEEQARRRAEEEARQAAEEKARREAEELAKKEAQERARQEAEEAARLKAEEKARQQAEAKARKEAEAQAKREAREQARREAEERARQEAERKAQLAAEEKARKEAEAQARHEAKEKARQAAEEAARQKAEAAARLKAEKEAEKAARAAAKEAEKAAREAAKKAAKEAAIGAAKSAAEEAGKTGSAATAAANAGSQTSPRAEDTIDAALPETASSSRSIRITLPFSLGKLVRVSALALAALSVAGLGLIHIVPFNGRLAQLEQEAGAQFGKPVKIGSLNLSLLPQPHWRLQEVSIGADNEIVIPQVNATAVIGSLFSGPMQFHSVELVSPVIDEKGLGWILFGQAPGTPWQVTSVNASQVKLRMRQVQVPLFNASAEFDNAGVWRKIDLNAPAEKLHVDLARAEGAPRFEFTANDLVLPFGGTLAFDTLNASGTIERGGLDIGKFSAIIYDGTVSGSATLRWQDGWSFKGAAQARHVAPVRLAPGLFHGGTLEGDFSYAMQSAEADRLLASPQARGSFSVNGGTLTGVDMASHVMGQAGTGKTSFNELNGDFTYEGGKVKLSRMRLAAGLLSAGGEAAVDADGKLSGHVSVDLRTASRQAHSAFNIGGTPAEPKFSR